VKKTKRDTSSEQYEFRAKVWVYNGPTPWHFVTLPKNIATEIKLFHSGLAKNFGTISVLATIGHTTWKTSVFSDTQSGSYVLPLKAEVRKKKRLKPMRSFRSHSKSAATQNCIRL
jgi:hypothetical protein